jgi:hypothetical protein
MKQEKKAPRENFQKMERGGGVTPCLPEDTS